MTGPRPAFGRPVVNVPDLAGARCSGRSDLFDAIDPASHQKAVRYCRACPVIEACEALRADLAATGGVYGGPEGTWAGKLVILPTEMTRKRLSAISKTERLEAEEARFSQDEARRAHTAYAAGERSEWAETGHRVYGRRRKRNKRVNGDEAA